jgi:phosphorylcholine metabolism protein LicD
MKAKIHPWLTKKGLKKIVCMLGYIPYKICALFINREKILQRAINLQTQFNEAKTLFLYPHDTASCGKWFIPSTVFDSLESVIFENTVFTIPSGYDEYLKSAYGDYM